MGTKEMAYNMIDKLTEDEINAVIVILNGLTKEKMNHKKKIKTQRLHKLNNLKSGIACNMVMSLSSFTATTFENKLKKITLVMSI